MQTEFNEQQLQQQTFTSWGDGRAQGRVTARFYWQAVPDGETSTKAGYPAFKEEVYVITKAAGTKDFVARPVDVEARMTHAKEWAEFEQSKPVRRTPIHALPKMTLPLKATFEALGIHTVEALIEQADRVPESLREFVGYAKRWQAFCHEVETGQKPRMRLVNGQFEEIAA